MLEAKKNNTILLQNDFVEIQIVEEVSLLTIKWKRQISFEERVIGYKEAYFYFKRFQIKNLLIDSKKVFLFTPVEKEWLYQAFNKWAPETQVKKIALITSVIYQNMSNLTEFATGLKKTLNLRGKIEHELFIDYETASLWLQE